MADSTVTQWIFPIAGKGDRVKERGEFKPFIPVCGRRILEWCLFGIRDHLKDNDSLFFVTTKELEQKFNAKKVISEILSKLGIGSRLEFIQTDATPKGPAASVQLAFPLLKADEPCITVNCDQYTRFSPMTNLAATDAFVPLYMSMDPKSSFARIEDGKIVELKEKNAISYYATAGIYGFGSAKALIDAINEEVTEGTPLLGEYYVASALNRLIKRGGAVYPASTTFKFDLGDLASISSFERWMGSILGI